MDAGATLRDALHALREQLATVEEMLRAAPDADTLALRTELQAAVADAERALGGDEAASPAGGTEAEEDEADAAPCEGVAHTAAPGNAGIHPRNRYARAAPDFAALAARQPLLAPFLEESRGAGGAARIDFRDAGATRALTAALLAEDFGVAWWLPDGHLCPALTGRCNYVHWLEDLLALSPPPSAPDGRTRGLDIGTGASAVYALLGAAMNGWAFVATDVTDEALRWARRNVAANAHLAPLIEVRDARSIANAASSPVEEAGAATPPLLPLLSGVVRPGERFAFTMCNPPFFDDLAEAGRNPGTACGGTAAEMAVRGGEAAFVTAHISESATPALRGASHWFTTLCGKKATLRAAVAELRRLRAAAVRTTVFSQGRTQRWGLAWSWADAAAAQAQAPLPLLAPMAARPCASASLTLRVGRAAGAAAAALAAVRDAAQAAGASGCTVDDAAFAVAGRLPPPPPQPPPPRKRSREDDADPAPEPAFDAGFAATVLQHAPGELTVRLALRRGRGAPGRAGDAAEVVFGRFATSVRAALAARWPG